LSWELPNPTEPLSFQEKSFNFSILLSKYAHQIERQSYHYETIISPDMHKHKNAFMPASYPHFRGCRARREWWCSLVRVSR
jgi:hypothetical protein